MRKNMLKEKIRNGESAIGTFVKLTDPAVPELLALAESVKSAEDDICTAGENTEPPVELGEGEIWREEPWTDTVSG